MSESIKIGWRHTDKAFPGAVILAPEKFEFRFDAIPPFARCPAVADFFHNTFVIRSPFDVYLYVDDQGNICTGGEKNNGNTSYVKNVTDLMTHHSFGSDHDIVQIPFGIGFVSDVEGMEIELLPPIMIGKTFPFYVIPGKYNIYDWPLRSINCAFDWVDKSTPINIKRGDILTVVRFNTKQKVELVHLDLTIQVQDMIDQVNGSVNYIKTGSRKMMSDFKEIRPKKLIP
jgi:hypothetical protein